MAMALGKGKRKQQQAAIADRGSKRPQLDDEAIASSSTSPAPQARRNGGPELHGSPEDATSDAHSVLEEPPPPEASTQSIETQGEPPTAEGSKWNFNLEESPGGAPGGKLTVLPAVPTDCLILAALPSEEERAALPAEVILHQMVRCYNQHRMVG